jgi:hypothetical protein
MHALGAKECRIILGICGGFLPLWLGLAINTFALNLATARYTS